MEKLKRNLHRKQLWYRILCLLLVSLRHFNKLVNASNILKCLRFCSPAALLRIDAKKLRNCKIVHFRICAIAARESSIPGPLLRRNRRQPLRERRGRARRAVPSYLVRPCFLEVPFSFFRWGGGTSKGIHNRSLVLTTHFCFHFFGPHL